MLKLDKKPTYLIYLIFAALIMGMLTFAVLKKHELHGLEQGEQPVGDSIQ